MPDAPAHPSRKEIARYVLAREPIVRAYAAA